MSVVQTKYRGSKEYYLAYAELVTAARYRGTVTYQEIAQIMGLPLRGRYMANEVARLVGEISEDEHLHGRPMLSAIVVRKHEGDPGAGFFVLAKDLGKLQDDSEAGKRRFWEQEKAAVYATWQRELRPKK